MSLTVVNDWRFLPDADVEAGMSVIREYIDYLKRDEPGLELSLWLRVADDPLRFFHLATYRTREALERQWTSEGTQRFVHRLSPLIDQSSVVQPIGHVVASSGGKLEPL